MWPAAIVLLGGCVPWLTGMGFALVAVPTPTLLPGPADGVPAGAWTTRQLRWPDLLLTMGMWLSR